MNDMVDPQDDLRDQITITFTEDDEAYEQRARWEESMTMEDIFGG